MGERIYPKRYSANEIGKKTDRIKRAGRIALTAGVIGGSALVAKILIDDNTSSSIIPEAKAVATIPPPIPLPTPWANAETEIFKPALATESENPKTFKFPLPANNWRYRENIMLVLIRLGPKRLKIHVNGEFDFFDIGNLTTTEGYHAIKVGKDNIPGFGACDVASWMCQVWTEAGLECAIDQKHNTIIPGVPEDYWVNIWHAPTREESQSVRFINPTDQDMTFRWKVVSEEDKVKMWVEPTQ